MKEQNSKERRREGRMKKRFRTHKNKHTQHPLTFPGDEQKKKKSLEKLRHPWKTGQKTCKKKNTPLCFSATG